MERVIFANDLRLTFGPRLIRVMTILASMLALLTIGSLVWIVLDARHGALRQAEQSASNLSLSLTQDIDRTLTTLDLSLLSAAEGMAMHDLASMPAVVQQAILFDGAIGADGLGGVFITDANGNVIHDSRVGVGARANVAERPYFKRHQTQAGLGLVISPPYRSRRSGEWMLGMARRLNAPDGSFAGIVAGGVRLTLFQALFRSLDLGDRGNLTLFGLDNRLVIRQPFSESEIGIDLSGAPVIRHIAETGFTDGIVEATSFLDGQERLYSYHRIGKFSLILSLGFSKSEIYADWMRKAAAISLIVALLFAVVVGLAMILARELRLRSRAERSARQSAVAARRSEAELADALVQLDALFQHSGDKLFVARSDPHGRFVYESINPTGREMMGARERDPIGQPPAACFPVEVAEQVQARWDRCIVERAANRYSITTKFGGKRRVWETFLVPIFDEAGNVFRLVGNSRDVTERNLNDAMLHQAQKMEALGQLTAGVAHEFNNLLQTVIGGLDMIAAQPGLDGRGRNWLGHALGAARNGASLTHRLLAFSRQQLLTLRETPLVETFASLADLLSPMLGPHIRLSFDVAPEADAVFVDAGQLEACLLNLAINARDAMPYGRTLSLRSAGAPAADPLPPGLKAGDYVCISVEDSGIGMPEQVMTRAFDPFFTTKGIGEGSGLGLSMVQGFCRQSGGDVVLHSAAGRGTMIVMWLPQRAPAAQSSEAAFKRAWQHQDRRVSVPELEIARGAAKRRVFVVDDVPSIRLLLSQFQMDAGLEVTSLASAIDAINALTAGEACDLVVTDQSMPGLSGVALLERIAILRPGLPALIVTGYDKVNGLGSLPQHVQILHKPVKRSDFIAAVRAALVHGVSRRALHKTSVD